MPTVQSSKSSNAKEFKVWFSSTEASKYLGTTPNSLAVHRSTQADSHPIYYRKGRTIYYRITDLDAWIESGLVSPAKTH
ncbi:MAG: helix-turn-helix domain-containing protein [Colwellia sp.]|nr:helix-turn-helix domain-containing protein [Colwellia sp.]